jgi:hypothetical protein
MVQLLLNQDVNIEIFNGKDLTPYEYTENQEIRKLILNKRLKSQPSLPAISIFPIRYHPTRLEFEIRSCRSRTFDTINVVYRSLDDFGFMRLMFAKEFPEAIFPDFRDLVSHQALLFAAATESDRGVRMVAKIAQRFNLGAKKRVTVGGPKGSSKKRVRSPIRKGYQNQKKIIDNKYNLCTLWLLLLLVAVFFLLQMSKKLAGDKRSNWWNLFRGRKGNEQLPEGFRELSQQEGNCVFSLVVFAKALESDPEGTLKILRESYIEWNKKKKENVIFLLTLSAMP